VKWICAGGWRTVGMFFSKDGDFKLAWSLA